jgi:hypothetical protein
VLGAIRAKPGNLGDLFLVSHPGHGSSDNHHPDHPASMFGGDGKAVSDHGLMVPMVESHKGVGLCEIGANRVHYAGLL